jgi:hypothetical protein
MSPSSQCHLEQSIHQQGLGQSLRKLIRLIFGGSLSGTRKRRSVSDLPASLRHDIGLEPDPDTGSFEGKWQQELKCLRR